MDLETVPIASLAPSLERPASKWIRAVVTLIWPYSSSTRSAALLLAEPDFRLRKSKGQVRVVLRGASARLVAESRIGIGDEVHLSLAGLQWREDTSVQDAVRTPGRNVDWALAFGRKLSVVVHRNGQLLGRIDVDSDSPSPEPDHASDGDGEAFTPFPDPSKSAVPPTSSIFAKHGRLSGDSINVLPYNPFGEGERAAKRVRRSWGDVNSWKLSSRMQSPEHTGPAEAGEDWGEAQADMQATPTQFGSAFRGSRQPPALWNTSSKLPHPLLHRTSPGHHALTVTSDEPVEYDESVEASDKHEGTRGTEVVAEGTVENALSVESEEASPSQAKLESISERQRIPGAPQQTAKTGGSETQPIVLSDSDEEEESEEEYEAQPAAEVVLGAQEPPQLGGLGSGGSNDTQDLPAKDLPGRSMLPPLRPFQASELSILSSTVPSLSTGEPQAPPTPELQAVPSALLPLPSPFPIDDEAAHMFPEAGPTNPPTTVRTPEGRPQTSRTPLQADQHLPVPRQGERKSRTSSSSSYRRENGPFGEHFRAKAPFGLDGHTFIDEQAVSDSPELTAKDTYHALDSGYPDLDPQLADGLFDPNAAFKEFEDAFAAQSTGLHDPFLGTSLEQPLYPLLPNDVAPLAFGPDTAGADMDIAQADASLDIPALTPPSTAEQQLRLEQSLTPSQRQHQVLGPGREPQDPTLAVLPPTPAPTQATQASSQVTEPEQSQYLTPTLQVLLPVQPPTTDERNVASSVVDPLFSRTPERDKTDDAELFSTDEAKTFSLVPTKGLRTALSYYVPLHPSHLRPYLNTMSQPLVSSQDALIDVIAVVTSAPSVPKRATAGPRDWHVVMSVARPESWSMRGATWEGEMPRGEVQAQCFAPGKHGARLLPAADVGDVVLLRDFAVQSQKGRIRLLNRTHGSGWCVWRFRLQEDGPKLVEEVNGPPVEVGDEERHEVGKLRRWWLESGGPGVAHNGLRI